MMKIPKNIWTNEETLALSEQLIDKTLMSAIDGILTGGMIVETEAYLGITDRACHAYNGKKTKRNAMMYETGGPTSISANGQVLPLTRPKEQGMIN